PTWFSSRRWTMERNVTFGRPSREHEHTDAGVTPSKHGAMLSRGTLRARTSLITASPRPPGCLVEDLFDHKPDGDHVPRSRELALPQSFDEGERHSQALVHLRERVAMLLDSCQIISTRPSCPDATAPQLNRVGIGGKRKRDGQAT